MDVILAVSPEPVDDVSIVASGRHHVNHVITQRPSAQKTAGADGRHPRRQPPNRSMTSPSAHHVTARDLFLSADLTDADARIYLLLRGFRDPVAADEHLQALATDLPTRHALGAVAETLIDALSASADPNGALVAFTRYLATRAPLRSFLRYLGNDPRAAQILTQLLGASPSLCEILTRNPEYFHWLQLALKSAPPDRVDPPVPIICETTSLVSLV